MTQASVPVDNVAGVLNDASHEVWSEAQLLAAAASGQKAIATARPDLVRTSGTFTLTADQVLQTMATAEKILDVPWILDGSDNPARALNRVDLGTKDANNSAWVAASSETYPQEVIIDQKFGKNQFAISPPVDAALKVQVTYVPFMPDTIANVSTNLSISDNLTATLEHFMLWRCWVRDGVESPTYQKGQHERDAFYDDLGIEKQARDELTAKIEEKI